MSETLLEVEAVSKSFGGVQANRDISLCVPCGKITGLIGPNGSGKTTLFNTIVGYHPIDSGHVRFDGEEITRLRVADIARRGLLRTFQQTRIYGRMDCVQNMQISAPARGWRAWWAPFPRRQMGRVDELLDFVGLSAKRRCLAGELSFGQQKLLELAMALMAQPRLLLLDEPTAGINPSLINALMERLRVVNRELGISLFIIEHNMRVIMELADHIYCLAHGELLAQGRPREIQDDARVIDAYLGVR